MYNVDTTKQGARPPQRKEVHMVKPEIIRQLAERGKKYQDDYEYVGIRVQEQAFELGPIYHCSNVWDDGEMTEIELNGICTIDIDHVERAMYKFGKYVYWPYRGDHVAVIVGNRATYGEDLGELVIEDPVVVEKM